MAVNDQNQQLPTTSPLAALLRTLEQDESLDGLADRLVPLAQTLTKNPTVRDLLLGKPLGHAAHPLLTDLPIGSWTSAMLLDLVGGRDARPAARLLTGFGILAAVPTAVTGWAEWAEADRVSRRVGLVHAGSNTVALLVYVASWLARRGGHHRSGAALGLLAAGGATVGGLLGGHLAIARKVGSRDPSFTIDVEN